MRPNELPRHLVKLTKPFYIGVFETTEAAWKSVMELGPNYPSRGDRYPIHLMMWSELLEFLNRTHLELPTEAQWEFACRAGTTEATYGPLPEIAWYGRDTHAYEVADPLPVGLKSPNALGLYDMLGNVWEWCDEEAHGLDYGSLGEVVVDPLRLGHGWEDWPSRVLRGGGLGDACWARASSRFLDASIDGAHGAGFRVVVEVGSAK